MPESTNATRQSQFKARKRAAGYIPITEWIHKSDLEKVRAYLKALESAREQ